MNTPTAGRFGFLLHPLDMADVIRFEPKAANKRLPLVERILDWMPAHVGSEICGVRSHTGATTDGWFITIPMLPQQFVNSPRDKVMEKIIQGGRIAQDKGAKIVGLGAYTSVVGDAGITVANNLDIAVTSGSSYTIATAIEGAMAAAQALGIELSQARVTVVGASGAIGGVCAHMLARHVKSLTLVARSMIRLKRMAESIHTETGLCPKVACDVATGLSDADIVVTATSSTGNIIRPHDLKPGALVCDVSMPHDTCREVATERPDVLVIEGGLVEVPGDVQFNYDFGYPPRVALACMAETMILALEGRFENFSLGRGIRREQVEEITRLARKHGFRLAGFRSFDRLVTQSEIDNVRHEAIQRRKALTYSISEAV